MKTDQKGCLFSGCCGMAKAQWLLRAGLGLYFLLKGLVKITSGLGVYAATVGASFEATWVPMWALTVVLYLLPIVEIALGIFLLSGWKKQTALAIAGIIFLVTIAGNVMKQAWDAIPNYMVFLLVAAGALAMDCECEEEKKE